MSCLVPGFTRPDGFFMTASGTMLIMSVGGLVTTGLLLGVHSAHTHLHFHWRLFSPHKKAQHTNLWVPLSRRGAWNGPGTGLESRRFKSQLIVPLVWEGEGGRILVFSEWGGGGGLAASVHLSSGCDPGATRLNGRHPIQLFGHLRRFCCFVFILISNLITDERMEHKGKRGETSARRHFSSKSRPRRASGDYVA